MSTQLTYVARIEMTARQDPNALVCGVAVVLGTPRRLPKAARLAGRVAVLDIAFASESGGRQNAFEHTTLRFIEQLGERLIAWVDHHDSEHHARFAADPRFVLATKAEHGACPEMITPERVASFGEVDTIVCHNDFDGLASAAKWLLGGKEPYPGCDADARAVDTRIGEPGPIGAQLDRALRARPRDPAVAQMVVRHLAGRLADPALGRQLEAIAREVEPLEQRARRLAADYVSLTDELALVDVSDNREPYDKTLLLMLGQRQRRMAAVLDGETVTFAAPFDSGVNFLERFGLSGGMPTLVSLHRAKLSEALERLGVDEERVRRLADG